MKNPYSVIKEPHISEKTTALNQQNKYVFKIAFGANKTEVKKAIQMLYRVKVKSVQIIHLPPRQRRLGRFEGWRQGLAQGYKKAIVTLAEGQKIEPVAK